MSNGLEKCIFCTENGVLLSILGFFSPGGEGVGSMTIADNLSLVQLPEVFQSLTFADKKVRRFLTFADKNISAENGPAQRFETSVLRREKSIFPFASRSCFGCLPSLLSQPGRLTPLVSSVSRQKILFSRPCFRPSFKRKYEGAAAPQRTLSTERPPFFSSTLL